MTSTPSTGTSGRRSLARNSAVMAAGSFVSRALGVVRSSMLVTVFGLSLAGDAFAVANTLPNTVYLLVAGGVLNAVLVPQITKAQRSADGGRDFVDRLITLVLVALGVVTVLCLVGTPVLVRLMSSFAWGSEPFVLAVQFALIAMPAIFFYGLYTILGQVLNARERFGPYMWAPVLCNVVWIAGLGYFLAVYGRGGGIRAPSGYTPEMVWILAGSLTLGVALQALVLLVPLWRSGFRYRPRWGFRGVGLGSAGRVAGWTFAALAVSQVGLVVQSRVLTSVLPGYPGKLAFDQAFLLFMTPHGLITVSVVTALFTTMSRAASGGDRRSYIRDVNRGLSISGVATVPIAVGTLLLGTSLTRILYPASSIQATDAIGYVTMAMMVGLPAFGWYYVVQRGFFAFEDARTPFFLQLLGTGLAVAVALASYAVTSEWRAILVALGQAAGNIACAIVGVLWLRRRLGGLALFATVRTQVRVLLACLPAAALAAAVFGLAQLWLSGIPAALLSLLVGGGLFAFAFVLAARRLHIEEVHQLIDIVRRRGRVMRSGTGDTA